MSLSRDRRSNKTKMAVACASRFAVLKIEDDDEPIEAKKSCRSNSKPSANQIEKKKPKKKTLKPLNNKDNTAQELQSLAFVTNKSKKKPNSTSKTLPVSKKPGTREQWEEWKKKDDDFVNDSYENDLKQALLMSRLEFEEKKKSEPLEGGVKIKEKKLSKKKEKPSTLSLGQFNNLLPSQIESLSSKEIKLEVVLETPSSPVAPDKVVEEDIWDNVAADSKDIIDKEKSKRSLPKEIFARSLQFQNEIEKREKQIETLGQEVDDLKNELQTVKLRNKKLCNILGQGEMREKAEILIQVDQLTKVKDELTQEISELHAALEQERSKVHNLQTELKKCQAGRKESK